MTSPATSGIDALELQKHRPQLLKFAMLQLRNAAAAEDAVQETLVAALQASSGFAGQSSVKTWLVGILKHKIIDAIRKQSREQPLGTADDEIDIHDLQDAVYREDGHFREDPADWGDPEAALRQRKFFEVLERCMEGLPKKTARAFMMREVMGLETEEICKDLGITSTNCWVLLYRARMALRECLEGRWFAAGETI
ncbi:MAG TPA: sigma-70 family RNA polymerase sigma factor [Burkholderiales bacterium]|nr:sigma-70 family RNA polymerase sigma factor [Burkholderiales bacterium]